MSMMPIDQALGDPNLLGAALGEPETWATWLVALKAAFGIELTEVERGTFASIAAPRAPTPQSRPALGSRRPGLGQEPHQRRGRLIHRLLPGA